MRNERPATGEEWLATDAAFDRALDLGGPDRESYLLSLPDDRRRRVVSLLASAERDGPLSRGLGEVAAHLLESADASLEPAPEDRRLGPWRLLRPLGSGGMGVVHLAERSDGAFDQQVALKVIRWELAESELVGRFLDERQILAQLSHPHIATLIDGGMTDGGLPYLVLEYVDGQPIDEYCRAEGLDRDARIRLLIDVCRAVDFAHRQLVVHRDLKPSNILVRRDGVPKLVDFGVAKLLDEAAGPGLAAATRMAPMTPRYAAPEQLGGGAISVATDVWSLGLVLVEVLSEGRIRPPEADTATPDAERERRRLPARLDSDPSLAGDLAAVLGRALREEPEERYRTAGALADDLERFVEGLPVDAVRPTLAYRTSKLVRRHRALTAAIVAAGLTAVLGISGVVWQAREARQERDAARQEALRAEQTKTFLQNLFSGSVPQIGGEPRVRDLLDEGARRIRTELDGAPRVRSELLATLGQAYKWLEEHDEAWALYEEALAIEENLDPGSRRHALVIGDIGGLWLFRDRPEKAMEHFGRSLEMLDALGEGRSVPRAETLSSLGMALRDLGRLEEAVTVLEEAVDIARELEEPMILGAARGNLARCLHDLGRVHRAESEHRAALGIYLQHAPRNTTVATIRNNLALTLAKQGRLGEALETVREARSELSTLDASPRSVPTAEANLAYLLLVAGRSAEAAELAARAAEAFESLPDSKDRLGSQVNLGWALALDGDHDAGLQILRDTVAGFLAGWGPDHPTTLRGRTRYGAALHRAGRLEEARNELAPALEGLADASSTIVRADLALAAGPLGCDDGRPEEGLEWVEEALRLYSDVYGPDHWLAARARVERARCLSVLGRPWDREEVVSAHEHLVEVRGPGAWGTERASALLEPRT